MKDHKCSLCGKEFRQKIDLERHLDRKNTCISNRKLLEAKKKMSSNDDEITGKFKSLLNYLRNDSAHLVGENAFYELSRFIIWNLLEKHQEKIGLLDVSKFSKEMQENQ